MRIRRLHLPAFGPFTDLDLDLAPGAIDLHVIHGPNEAGKSSCLRGLQAWLFGFPERTRDDFLHPRPRLLAGGELEETASGWSVTGAKNARVTWWTRTAPPWIHGCSPK